MKRDKGILFLFVGLLIGILLAPFVSGTGNFMIPGHWRHDVVNNFLVPVNDSVDVSFNNNSIVWLNGTNLAGDNISWDNEDQQFDVTGAGFGLWNYDGTTVFPKVDGSDAQINGSLALESFLDMDFNDINNVNDLHVDNDADVGNDLHVADKIENLNDATTYFDFNAGQILFFAGGVQFLNMQNSLATVGVNVVMDENLTVANNTELGGTLDMTGNNITNANLSEQAGINVDYNYTRLQFDVNLNSTFFLPFEINTVDATVDTGDVGSLFVASDGDSYNISEELNKDWVIYINFSGVTDIDFIILRQWYDAAGIEKGHSIHPSLWDWDLGDWDEEYGDIFFQDHFKYVVRNVFDADVHIGTGGDLGKVRMRLWHDNGGDKGRPQHDFRLDYAVLVSGFSPVTSQEHDSLSGRNTRINHPWAMPTDGSRNGTGDFIFEKNMTIDGNLTFVDNSTISATGNLTIYGDENTTIGRGGQDIILGNDTLISMRPYASAKVNTGTITHPFNNGFWAGKLDVVGGVDPAYVLFNKESLFSILARIDFEVPKEDDSKFDGLALWGDGTDMFALNPKTKHMEQFVWKSDYDALEKRVKELELLMQDMMK